MTDNASTFIPAKSYASDAEVTAYKRLLEISRTSPIADKDVLANLGLFLTRSSLSRILFMQNLYQKILHTHGVIMEFGVRWGQNMALLSSFRSMYEPYNQSRKIIGFDTFEGFPSVSPQDGSSESAVAGALSVTAGYEDLLSDIITQHEKLAPRSHIKKHELIKGDVCETLPKYLAAHPETIIAFAYFDLDIYAPTKRCLELIRPHLVKNSVIGFDELVLEEYPGETQALKEAWGVSDFEIIRDPLSGQQSYLIVR